MWRCGAQPEGPRALFPSGFAIAVCLVAAWLCAGHAAAAAVEGVPLFPFTEESPEGEGSGDTLSGTMLHAIEHPASAGAMVLLCWKNEESDPGESPHSYHFLDTERTTLNLLAHHLAPRQQILIGIKAGNCSPDWLKELGVPMAKFWQAPLGGKGGRCAPIELPPSYDDTYVRRYVAISAQLWQTMAEVRLTADGSTLQSHVRAFKNAGMVLATSGEMGILSSGCASEGKVYETQREVAETWSRLPSPDNYTPAKAQAAYARMLEGLFAFLPPQVPLSQAVIIRDEFGWPLVDAAGRPLPERHTRSEVVPMFRPILTAAARRYGKRIIFGFNELSLGRAEEGTPEPAQNVIEAGTYGAGVEWELNGNGEGGTTSCRGRHDLAPADPDCFARILALGASLVPPASNGGKLQWIEFQPIDAVATSHMLDRVTRPQ